MTDETSPGNTSETNPQQLRWDGEDEHRDSTDTLMQALSNTRRRIVLQVLSESSSGVLTLASLAARVHRFEQERLADGPDDDTERVTISLFHVHVPSLVDAGLVEYDDRTRTIRYRGDDRTDQMLDLTTASQ